jgi:hypothetical protein
MSLRPLRSALEAWRPFPAGGGDPLSVISAAWAGIVGARVAQDSSPLEVSGDALIVATRSSAWSQQLQFLAPQILERIQELAVGRQLTRLHFRTGKIAHTRKSGTRSGARANQRIAAGPAPLPAADETEAFERLRRRVAEARRLAPATCATCSAPIERGTLCAPCEGSIASRRRTALERVLFNAPWLSPEEIRLQVRDAGSDEIEAARRALLQRWWLVLERARRTGRDLTRRERSIASSYVLLQSGLAPDRITPAVVRNVLGDEMEAQLSGAAASKKTSR